MCAMACSRNPCSSICKGLSICMEPGSSCPSQHKLASTWLHRSLPLPQALRSTCLSAAAFSTKASFLLSIFTPAESQVAVTAASSQDEASGSHVEPAHGEPNTQPAAPSAAPAAGKTASAAAAMESMLQKDAFLVFRALCKLSVRSSEAPTGTDLTAVRGKVCQHRTCALC